MNSGLAGWGLEGVDVDSGRVGSGLDCTDSCLVWGGFDSAACVFSPGRTKPAASIAFCSSALVGNLTGDLVLTGVADDEEEGWPHSDVALFTENLAGVVVSLVGDGASPFGGEISCSADVGFSVSGFTSGLGDGRTGVGFMVSGLVGSVGNCFETLRSEGFEGGVAGLDMLLISDCEAFLGASGLNDFGTGLMAVAGCTCAFCCDFEGIAASADTFLSSSSDGFFRGNSGDGGFSTFRDNSGDLIGVTGLAFRDSRAGVALGIKSSGLASVLRISTAAFSCGTVATGATFGRDLGFSTSACFAPGARLFGPRALPFVM